MALRQNSKFTCVLRKSFIYSIAKTRNMSSTAHLNTEELPFEEKPLFVPTLEEIRDAICQSLSNNFNFSTVEIVDCPDLTDQKFGLVDKGLGGSPTLIEVGGPAFLLPLVQRDKLYNVKEILVKSMGSCKKIFAVGAGAGPYPLYDTNCEGIFNVSIKEDDTFTNGSYSARVEGPKEECVLERIPDCDPRCAVLLNLFACSGEKGQVLKIHCKERKGETNFIDSIRLPLTEKFKGKTVGMGGVFLINAGTVHQHVMPDFNKTPINSEEEVNKWLRFYDMPAKLHALGTLVTSDHGMNLRLTHFHSFSSSNWGGHYHNDTTPDIVEYEAYLNVAERVVRVDKPEDCSKIGHN